MSPIDADNCYLKLSMLDDSNASTNVEILELKNNGKVIASENHIEYGPFSINEDEKVILDVATNMHEYFGCEVKIICK